MPRIRFENEEMEVEVEAGTTVLEAATQSGIFVRRSAVDCGGHGFPGCNCKIWLRASNGSVNSKTLFERWPFRKLHGTQRLACKTKVQGDIRVVTLP